MKARTYILVLMTIAFIVLSCDPQNEPSTEPEGNFVPGVTMATGTITNENGELLEGIMVEVFDDESLTHQLPYGGKWPVFTNEDGIYTIGRGGCAADVDRLYAVATDTTGTYESQVKMGELEFWYSPIWPDGTQDKSAMTIINFVLTKK